MRNLSCLSDPLGPRGFAHPMQVLSLITPFYLPLAATLVMGMLSFAPPTLGFCLPEII